jgi:hypothetical protein
VTGHPAAAGHAAAIARERLAGEGASGVRAP